MVQPIYRWKGKYFGFVLNERFFDRNSNYLGWIEGTEVWREDGSYLGEIVDDAYILRRTSMVSRVRRIRRVTPVTPVRPVSRVNRVARIQRVGYIDALDEYI